MKFSIVYPTRNRPELLRECIKSILNQDSEDWELIISDNDSNKSAENIYDEFCNDFRIKYFWTGGILSMADNFTFGLTKASGEYVTVLTDKTTLVPICLKICETLLIKEKYDIINWSEAHFYPNSNENIAQSTGYLRVVLNKNNITEFDPKSEITYLLEFNKHRSHDMSHYFRGKVLFGFVKRNLIKDLVEKNEFFLKYAPDYTSRMTVLSRAKKAIEISAPLQCAFISGDSNGMLCSIYPDKAYNFFEEADNLINVNKYFPIKGLYTSQQNHVAGDYLYSLSKLGIEANINLANLYRTILFDLLKVKWNNSDIKKNQIDLFYSSVLSQDKNFIIKFFLLDFPVVKLLHWRYILNKLRMKIFNLTKSSIIKKLLKYNEVNVEFKNIHEANLDLSKRIPLNCLDL